jgi:hypothetical protein
MTLKTQFGKTLVAWLPLFVLCLLVSPAKLPIVLLVVPFILLFVAFYNTWQLLALLWQWASGEQKDPPRRKQLAATVSGFVVLLALLGSLGQLGPKDVLTFGLIFVVAYFYVVRWQSKKSG